jgi:hypothetical protein
MLSYRSPSVVPLAACFLLSACSWDFEKLPVKDFRENLCAVLDNFQKNAQDNCRQIQDAARRDQCFRDINTAQAELAAAKLKAVIAYTNCNEAELKAAQAIAERIIEALTKVAGNLKNPLKNIDFNVQGQKNPGTGTQQMFVNNSHLVLLAGNRPTDPMQLQGQMVMMFQPDGQGGYRGPVANVQWTAILPGVSTWTVRNIPDPANQFHLQRQATGFAGRMRVALLVDGRGITWPIVVDLPLSMSLDERQWSLQSGGMVPAAAFFPQAPQAGIRRGQGCPGSNGRVPDINPASVSRIGDPLVTRIDEARPNSVAGVIYGLTKTDIPLDPIGGTNCSLLASPDLFLFAPTDPAGSSVVAVTMPHDASLVDAEIHQQAFVLDPVNALGIVFSGGMKQVLYGR